MRRCLLIECLNKHAELLPSWRVLFERLGYEVDIACQESAETSGEIAAAAGHRRAGLEALAALPAASYDFVVLNSLVNESYLVEAGRPRPDLGLLESLGKPSIAVIHEPLDWLEKRVSAAFDERWPGGSGTLFLLADGTVLRGDGSWAHSWSLRDGSLRLPAGEQLVDFESRDGGGSYRSAGGERRLQSRPRPSHDLSRHLAAGCHAVVTWSRQGRDYLSRSFPAVDWLFPLEFGEPAPPEHTFGVPGIVDYGRKAFSGLLDACARTALRTEDAVWVIGGGRSREGSELNGCRLRLRREVHDRGLEGRIRLTEYLPYGDYLDRVRRCRFLLPLVDDHVDGGAYRTKLPTAVALGVALGIPLVLEERLAERFDLGFMPCYPAKDMAAGLNAARALGDDAYHRLRAATLRLRRRLAARNEAVLSRLIARITSPPTSPAPPAARRPPHA
jgi:hypothetical protein